MTEEEKDDWSYLWQKKGSEGFDYCFRFYSNFEEIKDKKFHELREAYKKIANELDDYINKKADEL